MRLGRQLLAEFTGTAMLTAAVVGSGVMGERLAGGNLAIVLLANSLATGAALVALISTFGPVSGAHFNPLVTAAECYLGKRAVSALLPFILTQLAGAVTGVIATHWMFDLPSWSSSVHDRTGSGQWLSEVVATFGLLVVILQVARHRPASIPVAVGTYIAAGYWFTSSTSFANPALTIARAMTSSFAGIRWSDVLPFIAAQLVGAALAVALHRTFESANEG